MNTKNMFCAMRNLKGSAFLIWCYCMSYKANEQVTITEKAVCGHTGLSHAQYYRAINELIAKGYLEKKEKLYIFHESI